MFDKFTQRANKVRTARYVRVQAHIHDASGLFAFRIKHVQFFDQRFTILIGRVTSNCSSSC